MTQSGDEVLKYMERVLKGIKLTFMIPAYPLYMNFEQYSSVYHVTKEI